MTSPLISTTGSDSEGGDQNETGNDDVIDSDGMENWDGVPTAGFVRDIPASTPLPEPEKGKSKLEKVNAVAFFWFIFFLFGRHPANFVTMAFCGCFSF